MDIGSKIKKSRTEAKLTQEQAAEALGISRQTISNWENERSYPDFISVLKMSDLYSVSLDYLLKGEQTMSDYRDYREYLEESTNVVKSKTKLSKTIIISAYLVIWAVAVLIFWLFISGSDAMGYSLVFLWGIIPISTFVMALLIGKNDHWGRNKWFSLPIFGVMYMLAEYLTFSMANNITANHVNVPQFSLLLAGAVISAAGVALGSFLRKRK